MKISLREKDAVNPVNDVVALLTVAPSYCFTPDDALYHHETGTQLHANLDHDILGLRGRSSSLKTSCF